MSDDELDGLPVAPHTVTDDRGRRCAEAHNTARAQGGGGRFIAVSIESGRWDGVIYDSKDDAIRHQLHETQCAYIVVFPHGDMTDAEGTALLDVHERAYDAGFRLIDPDTVLGAKLAPMVPVPNRRERRQMERGRLIVPAHPARRRRR